MIYFDIMAAIAAGEAMIKQYILEEEKTGRKSRMLPGGVEIRRLENGGAAGGVLSDQKDILCIVSGSVLTVCAGMLFRESRKKKTTARGIGLSLLLGGGFCNLMDRLRKGTVTDYIRFTKCPVRAVRRLVFNISDFSILIGGLLLVLCQKFRIKKKSVRTISENRESEIVGKSL